MISRWMFLASIVMVLLSACGPRQAATPASPSPMASTDPAAANTPALVLRRSGGFAGVLQEWQVFSDGRVLIREGQQQEASLQVPAQAVAELLTWLDGSGFFSAQIPTPNPDETCCDRFLYELTASYNGQTNSVVVLDTPENLPGDLPEAFRRLEALLGVDL